jgi:peptide/nickel transport system substrate-binding protein
MRRRHLLTGAVAAMGCAALARPALGQGTQAAPRVLKFIPQADLAVLDPITTTSHVTRHHGFMVWDTLYGFDADFRPQPQMVEGHRVEEDGKRVTMRLRAGLRFHDGEPVRARDAVASIRRWAARDPMGQALMARTEELAASDDRTFAFRLRAPFPLLFEALARPSPPVCFIMPEALASQDPNRPLTGALIGSGPFRFLGNERVPGQRAAYARFAEYQPRAEGDPSWTAGPKKVNFDRVEWHVMPDPAAASTALQGGEADWWEQPTTDLQTALRRSRNVVLEVLDPTGVMPIARFNHLHPPFDKAAMRRALLGAVDQEAFLQATGGNDRSLWRDDVGFFPPGTPMASDAGLAALTSRRDIEKVKRELAEAGYNGERVVLLAPTDLPIPLALSRVAQEMLGRVGMNVELVATGAAAIAERRASREPVERGGWSLFCAAWSGLDMFDPGVHLSLRGNGAEAWSGWPAIPRIEELRESWLEAADLPAQQRIAREMQEVAFREVPYLPLGQFFQATAYRRGLTGMLKGLPLFWNVQRSG